MMPIRLRIEPVLSSEVNIQLESSRLSTLIAGQEAYEDIQTFGGDVLTSRNTFQKFFEPAEIQALLEDKERWLETMAMLEKKP